MMKEKSNARAWIITVAAALVLLIVASNCFFTLGEDESALVQRFGRIQAVYMREVSDTLRAQFAEDAEGQSLHAGTGLKFKVPFIDNVIKYPDKFIMYDPPPREVITSDKRKLYFDNSAQWCISNPLRFYKAYNNMDSAKRRIDDVLYSRMNEQVGKIISHDLITNRELSGNLLLELAGAVSADFVRQGIVVIDVRIKRTDLPAENYESIYNNMNTERQRIAMQHRSEGEEESLKIRSNTDREVITITSQALRDAEVIRGDGDGEAARVYNEAYGSDPAFFEFYNLLETYRLTVGDGSTMVIPLDSPFAKYLLGVTPEAAAGVDVPALPEE
ncbi:MAG: protease modulator HflC [Oscillospiraceae bacterium]|jgi:membrane protease subunit HflC|nr:protease modulator HflC [Oscillospiraceae bacterium]